ncbi:MAG: response regulator transcription factor [Paludibaculum sp.]
MSSKKITILLADDHSVVRQGFRRILESQMDMEIVGEASNGREAIERASTLSPDVVVMDVAMPELNGIEATRRLMESSPRTRGSGFVHAQGCGLCAGNPAGRGARLLRLKDAIDADLLAAVAPLRGARAICHRPLPTPS